MRLRPGVIGWALLALLAVGPHRPLHAALPERTRTALEALSRLKGTELSTNPALEQAVTRIARQLQGEPELVDLVRDFQLPGQETALVEVIRRHPASPQAVDAARWLLDASRLDLLEAEVRGPETNAVPMVRVLGSTADVRVSPLLQEALEKGASPALQLAAAHSLARTDPGALGLVASLEEGRLPAGLAEPVTALLRSHPSASVRSRMATLPSRDQPETAPWPSVEELAARRGNVARGESVFRRPDVACSTCHRVGDHGSDFGPALTEIGAKLARSALIDALLEPSQAISFGYEAWRVVQRDGEEVMGLLASETDTELVVRLQADLSVRIPKSDVVEREKLSLSIMPEGLHTSLSVEEFVDLIEYLASLRPPVPQ